MKILVADDDKGVRAALSDRLHKWGYDVVEAGTAKEAMKQLYMEAPPKIALINWTLPEMEGADICKRIVESGNVPFIYTILLSENRTDEAIMKALDGGACDFIPKPVNTAMLNSRIRIGARLLDADKRLNHYAREIDNYSNEMKRLSITDYLTGVYSRRYFFEQAILELERAGRYNRKLSVVIIDIDHFKQLNDSYGHLAGDEVLMVLAENAGTILRKTDLMARYGGEEFVLLLPETDGPGAFKLAERLRKSIEDFKVEFDDKEIAFTISIGIAEIKSSDETIEEMIAGAGEALNDAKKKGRNRTELKKD